MKEEWVCLKEIKGYEIFDQYFVSNSGKIKSLSREVRIGQSEAFRTIPERITYGIVNSCLYPNTKIHCNGVKKTIMIHRLVALAFVPNPLNLPEVNHEDGVKTNNIYTNFKWVTRSENQQHAFDMGLQKPTYGNLKHGKYAKN